MCPFFFGFSFLTLVRGCVLEHAGTLNQTNDCTITPPILNLHICFTLACRSLCTIELASERFV